jgi:hypothetical protein
MFTSFVTALAAVASVSALVVPRATPPAGWRADILESYDAYNTRYMALGCQNKHNSPFFDLCCHPLKSDETLATARDPSCDPSKASATTAAVKPTQPPTNDDDDDDDLPYCDDDDDEETTSHPVASPTKAPQTPTTTHKATSTPKPTTTQAKPTSTPKPASNNSGSSNSGVITGGFATFFTQNGVAGACGTVHKDSDFVAAMDYRRYGNLSVKSALCGKQVKITNPANGKSVTVTVADACPTCKNSNSIDLSVGAFKQIATEEQGMVGINWSFV